MERHNKKIRETNCSYRSWLAKVINANEVAYFQSEFRLSTVKHCNEAQNQIS